MDSRSVPPEQLDLRSKLSGSAPSASTNAVFAHPSAALPASALSSPPFAQLPSRETSQRTSQVPGSRSTFERTFNGYEGLTTEFRTNIFNEDARDMDDLDEMIRAGEAWIHKLYAFRSLARPLAAVGSQITSDSSASVRDQVNLCAYDICRPRIKDLVLLSQYVDRAILKVREVTIALLQPVRRKRGTPRAVYQRLLGLIDAITTLDFLKDMKAGAFNEYESFKKLFEAVRRLLPPEDVSAGMDAVNQLKGLFAPGSGCVLVMELKARLHKSPPSAEILLDLFAFAVGEIESERSLMPETKWAYLRFLPISMLILDSDQINVFKHKSIVAFSKLFKKYPCVPLLNDMKVILFEILTRCPNYAASLELNVAARLEWGSPPSEAPMSATAGQASGAALDNSAANATSSAAVFKNGAIIADGDSCVVSAQDELRREYELQHRWSIIRQEYDAITPKLAATHRRVLQYMTSPEHQARQSADFQEEIKRERVKKPLDPSHARRRRAREILDREVFDVTLEALRILSKWKEGVVAQAAFKSWKVASDETYKRRMQENDLEAFLQSRDAPETPHRNYEKAVRFNYSKTELNILVDVVCLIKALAAQLLRVSDVCAPCIKRSIHVSIQEFIQLRAVRIQHHVYKRKRVNATLQLTHMRNFASDWLDGVNPDINDYKDKKLPKRVLAFERSTGLEVSGDGGPSDSAEGVVDAKEFEDEKFVSNAARATTPSVAQLEHLRAFCEALHDPDKSESRFLSFLGAASSDVDRHGADVLRNFFNESYFYSYLTQLPETVERLADLSSLWYRECYLEIAKQVQFPISTSLPYVAIKEMISFKTCSPENIFYVMEIYNDAASVALHALGQRYLFDEIEAECDLALEQVVYILGDKLYNAYRSVAAMHHLSPQYRQRLREFKYEVSGDKTSKMWPIFGMSQKVHPPGGLLEVEHKRLSSLLTQSGVRLLGRTIDFSSAVTRYIDETLRSDINLAIRKFELAPGLSGVLELRSSLRVLRSVHEDLGAWLKLEAFDDVLRQVDARISPTSFRGRISDIVRDRLIQEIIPKYAYNTFTDRFVPPSSATGGPAEGGAKTGEKIDANAVYGASFASTYRRAHELERDFLGSSHIEAAIECMGGDVSVPALAHYIVDFAQDLIKERLNPAVAAQLSEALPFLPKSDVEFAKRHTRGGGVVQASKSAFEHYTSEYERFDHHHSKDLLRVFHELGNALLVLRLLQHSLDALNVRNVTSYGHLYGHDTADRLGPGPDAREPPLPEATPLMRRAKLATNALLSSAASSTETSTPEQEDASRLHCLAERLARVHVEDARRTPLFVNALRELAAVAGEVSAAGAAATGIRPWYESWSALLFMVARPGSRVHVMAKTECRGDGFLWGGNFFALGCFRGMRPSFEASDACARIARFDALDKVSVAGAGSVTRRESNLATAAFAPQGRDAAFDLNTCLSNIRLVYEPVNALVVSVLEIACPPAPSATASTRSFHPPGWRQSGRGAYPTATPRSTTLMTPDATDVEEPVAKSISAYPSIGTAYEETPPPPIARPSRPKSVSSVTPRSEETPPPPLPRPGSTGAILPPRPTRPSSTDARAAPPVRPARSLPPPPPP